MRLFALSLSALALAALSAAAAEPPGPAAVVEALDQACLIFVKRNDYNGYEAKAAELGITDFYGSLVRRSPGVDIFAIAATADAPFTRRCTIALDGPPALAQQVPTAVAAWAKTQGFKPDGAPTAKTNDEGRTYTQTLWKAPKAKLQINQFGIGPEGRANVVVTWSVAD